MQSERSHDELLETCVQHLLAATTYTDGYHIEVCEEPTVEPGETHIPAEDEDFTEARREHLGKIAGEGKPIVKIVPRSSATSRVLSGR